MILNEKIASQLPGARELIKSLAKEHGDVVVDHVTIAQAIGGMRGVKCLVTDVSHVNPETGIQFRGLTVPQVLKKLPKGNEGSMPLVGGMYHLLLTGEVPTKEQALEVEQAWAARAVLPDYLYETLMAMPRDTYPMTLFAQGVLALSRESKFTHAYHEGMKREDYWEPALEDALDLTARLPMVAAFIYRMKYFDDTRKLHYDPAKDYGANFAAMMGVEDEKGYADLARLYFILHSDHESGNASAHTMHLVGSTLADPFLSFSAALDALAGPLHGLANRESIAWMLDVRKRFNGNPSRDELRKFVWDTLDSGKVIPGYGHAVLRVVDPRFTQQLEFAKQHFPDDEVLRLAEMVSEVVPQVLREQGKAKDPEPNVDAISGTLQYHYGVRALDLYCVLFGIGRALGVSANYVWSRALGLPIERPKSMTMQMLEDAVQHVPKSA